jgi:hypothetical protein
MTMVSRGGAWWLAELRWWARLSGHFDILRLITLGLARSLRVFSRSCISTVASAPAAVKWSGGKAAWSVT